MASRAPAPAGAGRDFKRPHYHRRGAGGQRHPARFPQHELAEPENFLSLLHYFGLLSIRDAHGVTPTLAIPNQTVKRLMYGYLRDGYKDVGVFRVNLFRFEQLMLRMANEGEWRPVLEYLSEAIAAQTGIRDYVPGGAVHRPGGGVPRLGDGVLRRGGVAWRIFSPRPRRHRDTG